MSKCVICGNELLTGDIHWEQGMCNQCYNINRYPDPYFELKTDKRLLGRREGYIQSLEQQLAGKDKRIAVLEKALELACVNVNCMDCCHFNCRKEPYNEKHNCIECHALGLTQKHLSKYFLDQAKKELEEKDDVERR